MTSFLTLLSQWDKQEIEEKLSQRVEFSERAIGKLLQAYDRLLQRKEKLWESMKGRKRNPGWLELYSFNTPCSQSIGGDSKGM